MAKFNLLGQQEKLIRDIGSRSDNKEKNVKLALEFDRDYFDGSRECGYGGYSYDGRWIEVAKRLIDRYDLSNRSRFLDVGCAKGFLMHDLAQLCKGISVSGVDISKYAKKNAYGSTGALIDIGCCTSLPYEDDSFDATVAINSVHNLLLDECKQAIRELIRVTKNKKNIFIQVDAYSNDHERELFENWVLTAKTYMKPKEWCDLFDEVNFEGDYFWTIIGFSE